MKRTFYQESDVEEVARLREHRNIIKKNKEAFEEEIKDLQKQMQSIDEDLVKVESDFAEYLLTHDSLKHLTEGIRDVPQLIDIEVERGAWEPSKLTAKTTDGRVDLTIGSSHAIAVIDGKQFVYDTKKREFKNCRSKEQKELLGPLADFVWEAIDKNIAGKLMAAVHRRTFSPKHFIENIEWRY
jgi:hypothetical protein